MLVVVVGSFNVFVATRLAFMPAGESTFLPAIWPLWFLVAGVACLWFASMVHSDLGMALSGALTVTAYASRAVAVLVDIQRGALQVSEPRGHVFVALWVLSAVLVAFIWLRWLKPISEVHQANRGR